jgi:hypothetical protein
MRFAKLSKRLGLGVNLPNAGVMVDWLVVILRSVFLRVRNKGHAFEPQFEGLPINGQHYF